VIQSDEGQVNILIVQARCERIGILRTNGKVPSEQRTLTLDGKAQKHSIWLGDSDECCDTSAAFVGSVLTIEAKATRSFTYKVTYSLTPEGDILEEVLKDGRGQGPLLAKKQIFSGFRP
jgi:hypothetical protein